MGRWSRLLTGVASRADDRLDSIRLRLSRGPRGPVTIAPYAGYGTVDDFRVYGRVLEAREIRRSADGDTWRTNLRQMLRRLETDEVPGARVRASVGEDSFETFADGEGYFDFAFKPTRVEPTSVWHEVRLEVLEPLPSAGSVIGKVLVPPPSCRFGVISDIDDTIIWTNVTDKLRMLKTVLLENARARLPFEGVPAFYKALQSGAGGGEGNPIFYVSGSPWNLYEFLVEIFEVHGLPEGPIRLRDFGTTSSSLLHLDTAEFKLGQIRAIMDRYPSLPFLLVGDSGEQDPEIYRTVVGEYPDRVLAVYIRNTRADDLRQRSIAKLAEEIVAAGSELVLSSDTRLAFEHAASKGYILE